jgi:hypothetical protein
MTYFLILKTRERTDEEKEKVRQKEVRQGGRRNKRRKGWTTERINAWRMEEKHKNQRKEIKNRGNQFAHMRCTPIMFRFLTRKREFSLFQSVLTSFGISSALYSVANEFSFVGGKMAGHEAGNSLPCSGVGMQLYPYSPIRHGVFHRDNLTLQFIHLS